MSLTGPRPIDSLHRRHGDPKFHVDWVLVAVTLAVAGFGVLNVYAARRQYLIDKGLNEFLYVRKQLIALGVGCAAAAIVALVDYRRWREYVLVLFGGTTFLLAVVPLIGHRSGGATAWFQFGSFELQPSELAKITLVLAIAAYLSLARGTLHGREVFYTLGIAGLPTALILLQPDLGTAMVFGAIVVSCLLIGGAKPRHLAVIGLLVITAAIGLLGSSALKDYQINRLTAFVSPTSEHPGRLATAAEKNLEGVRNNLRQSQIAIGAGGLHGRGYLAGTQTNGRFVPEQHTDFIFSAVGEQFGFVGGGLLLVAYGVMIVRIWRTAQLSADLFGSLICVGVLAWLVWQVFENVGMTMGIMPVTGIPLPLMSYGGSSTIGFLVGLGFVVNVHMRQYS
jgi:rod shape determining protein RodA